MIGPIILRGELITSFREHLLNTEYHYVIHNGETKLNSIARRLDIEQANYLLNNFINSRYPLVCKAGSKSVIPFFDYHVAVNSYNSEDKELLITELIVREPKGSNMINGVLMAFYMLINDRYKHERLLIPFKLPEIKGYDDIEINSTDNVTFLCKKIR